MPKSITVILLDKEPSSTPHYLELLREELERKLKPLKLGVVNLEVQEVVDQPPQKEEKPDAIRKV